MIVDYYSCRRARNVQEETSNINISNTLKELHLQAKGSFALKKGKKRKKKKRKSIKGHTRLHQTLTIELTLPTFEARFYPQRAL